MSLSICGSPNFCMARRLPTATCSFFNSPRSTNSSSERAQSARLLSAVMPAARTFVLKVGNKSRIVWPISGVLKRESALRRSSLRLVILFVFQQRRDDGHRGIDAALGEQFEQALAFGSGRLRISEHLHGGFGRRRMIEPQREADKAGVCGRVLQISATCFCNAAGMLATRSPLQARPPCP